MHQHKPSVNLSMALCFDACMQPTSAKSACPSRAGLCVQIDQLKQLRMWGSITPGHPERQMADGIEVTTGAAHVLVKWLCVKHHTDVCLPCRHAVYFLSHLGKLALIVFFAILKSAVVLLAIRRCLGLR